MPKHDFLSPKAISNRIKAKGLQKLRWYCQMCNKQCRDENGFKCHCESEGHIRQMNVFTHNSGRLVDGFSHQFQEGYLDLLRRRWNKRRVHCNVVYNEYIQDKDHVHMNATRWTALTGFVLWLGKQGICEVDQTEKGWFVKYIERDPEAMRRAEERARREKHEMNDTARNLRWVEEQVRLAKENETEEQEPVVALQRENPEDPENKISFALPVKRIDGAAVLVPTAKEEGVSDSVLAKRKAVDIEGKESKEEKKEKREEKKRDEKRRRPVSAIEAIIQEDARRKERIQRKRENWLMTGIIVKIMHKTLASGQYYKKKAEVMKVVDKFGAEVCTLDSRDILLLDQAHLETVIPNVGGRVYIVNGGYCGEVATLTGIDEKAFKAHVRIEQGSLRNKPLALDYEDICKLAAQ